MRLTKILGPAIVMATAGIAAGQGGESALEGLIANSPFNQTVSRGQNITAESAPLEFRAFMVEGSVWLYSVCETAKHRSFWLCENQTEGGITVKHFDEATGTLNVDYEDRPLSLVIQSAPRTPSGPATAVAGAAPRSSEPSPAALEQAEADRLQQVREEIQRRRALSRVRMAGSSGGR